jgi:hypothetical protein
VDPFERQVELVAAVAPQRVKGLPCQAFAVHPDQQIFGAVDLAGKDREVLLVSIDFAIHDHPKPSKARGQVGLGVPLDGWFVLA